MGSERSILEADFRPAVVGDTVKRRLPRRCYGISTFMGSNPVGVAQKPVSDGFFLGSNRYPVPIRCPRSGLGCLHVLALPLRSAIAVAVRAAGTHDLRF